MQVQVVEDALPHLAVPCRLMILYGYRYLSLCEFGRVAKSNCSIPEETLDGPRLSDIEPFPCFNSRYHDPSKVTMRQRSSKFLGFAGNAGTNVSAWIQF